MAGITLEQAESNLTMWLDAEAKVAEGQAYSIGNRSLTRANLKEIGERISFWDSKVQSLSRGGISIKRVIPL